MSESVQRDVMEYDVVIVGAGIAVALAAFVALGQRGRLGDGLVARDHQIAQHRVIEAERGGELLEHVLAALDVHQHVVRLEDLLNGIGQLTAAPVFQPVNLAARGLDGGAVTLDHGGNLFALVRVDQEHDFVMTHCLPLVD